MTTWQVRCAGHMKPGGVGTGRDCFVEGFYVRHNLSVLQLVRAAELLTDDPGEEGTKMCVLEVLAADRARLHAPRTLGDIEPMPD